MTLQYYDTTPVADLVREIFHLTIDESDLPFESKIIPVGFSSLTYSYGHNRLSHKTNSLKSYNGLLITGHFQSSYNMCVDHAGCVFGMNFHPTGLYKLTGLDISKFTNKHLPFTTEYHQIAEELDAIFKTHKNNWKLLADQLIDCIQRVPAIEDDKLEYIDQTINIIEAKEGLLTVNDLIAQLPFGQKTLETHFKKIVGITPGRFIRLHRFACLMRKYEGDEISLKNLIFKYDYFDRSHFARDFKLFMNESPNSYFDKDFPLIREYLKNQ